MRSGISDCVEGMKHCQCRRNQNFVKYGNEKGNGSASLSHHLIKSARGFRYGVCEGNHQGPTGSQDTLLTPSRHSLGTGWLGMG